MVVQAGHSAGRLVVVAGTGGLWLSRLVPELEVRSLPFEIPTLVPVVQIPQLENFMAVVPTAALLLIPFLPVQDTLVVQSPMLVPLLPRCLLGRLSLHWGCPIWFLNSPCVVGRWC